MAYRFTDHTADYGVQVNAFTAEEAFCDAARAMYEILFGAGAAKLFSAGNRGTPSPVKFQESSLPDLLRAWLSHHLDLYNQTRQVSTGWRIRVNFRAFRLEGESYLQSVDSLGLKLETEIKGVTYHELEAAAGLERTRLHFIVDV